MAWITVLNMQSRHPAYRRSRNCVCLRNPGSQSRQSCGCPAGGRNLSGTHRSILSPRDLAGFDRGSCSQGSYLQRGRPQYPCGLGSTIADALVESGSSAPLIRCGVDKYPVSGDSEDLFRAFALDHASLKKRFKDSMKLGN